MIQIEVSSNIADIAAEYLEQLGGDAIHKDLANAINAAQTIAKKRFIKDVAATYKLNKSEFASKDGYRIKRANAMKSDMESRAFITSLPIPLLRFVVERKPVSVLIRKRTTFKSAFIMGSQGSGTSDPKDAGVFIRRKDAAKVAPTKGSYAGRVHKVGPLKGTPILRQPFDKKYTLTTAEMANQVQDGAMSQIDLGAIFKSKLDARIAKNAKAVLERSSDA